MLFNIRWNVVQGTPGSDWKPWLLAVVILLCASAQAQAQPEVIAPTDNLVTQGIPPIPASLAKEVKYYNDLRPSGFRGWHPTERSILIGRRMAQVSQVF